MADNGWQRKFKDLIETLAGMRLNTLREAINYLAKLPRFRSFRAAHALQKSRKGNDLGSP
jgi:hypothetical protein